MLTREQKERYSQQMRLPNMGEQGQLKLLQASVLVVGAGGLGCPVLQSLVAAGVGTIGIIDDDQVSLSNLNRQILYATHDVGKPKVLAAFERLQSLNTDVQFRLYNYALAPSNAWNIVSQYDIIVDGSDNFSTRYLVSDACHLLNKPHVYGSIYQFEGQVCVFNHEGSGTYRDLFPQQPAAGEIADCSEAGVLGVLPGIIGNIMASEVIKLLTQVGIFSANKLLIYDSLRNSFYDIDFTAAKPDIRQMPQNRIELENTDYKFVCTTANTFEIDESRFDELLQQNLPVYDVREKGEMPTITEFENWHLPLSQLETNQQHLPYTEIIVFCRSGLRSKKAAALLCRHNPNLKVYILKSGIEQWKQNQINQTA